MGRWYPQDSVASDMRRLREMRKPRDRRRKPRTPEQELSHRIMLKRKQFDLALHRQGLVSPFDYEYPRLKQMSKLARELYDRHLAPMVAEYDALVRQLEDEEIAQNV